MGKNLSTILLVLVFLTGLSLLLYPSVSDYWNSTRQSKAIVEYDRQVSQLDQELYKQLWTEAEEYNRALLEKDNRYAMTDEDKAAVSYTQLDVYKRQSL